MRKRITGHWLLLLAAVTMGCGDHSGGSAKTSRDPGITEAVSSNPATLENGSIVQGDAGPKTIQLASLDTTIAQHKGKVVLVEFWFFG